MKKLRVCSMPSMLEVSCDDGAVYITRASVSHLSGLARLLGRWYKQCIAPDWGNIFRASSDWLNSAIYHRA